jgi:protein-disulfide isomerase
MIRKNHQSQSSERINKTPITEPKDLVKNNGHSRIAISKISLALMGLLLLVTTTISGYLYAKVEVLEKTKGTIDGTTAQAQQVQPQQQAQQANQPQISLETIKGLFGKNVIKFGKGDKKLLLVEVADPSCPYCHAVAGKNGTISAQMGPKFKLVADGGTYVPPVPEMKKLVDQGKAGMVWIYTRGHGNGELATKALYCANDQGKFWQAHDLLFTTEGYDLQNNQIRNDTTKIPQLVDFLASAVDKGKLSSCLTGGKYDFRLDEDSSLASSLGVNGTPGFFINTTNFAGAYSWTDMKPVVNAAQK